MYLADTTNRIKKRKEVSLAGDARCCSPGHTAKYGSYSLMDMPSGEVVDVQLIQVHLCPLYFVNYPIHLILPTIFKVVKCLQGLYIDFSTIIIGGSLAWSGQAELCYQGSICY